MIVRLSGEAQYRVGDDVVQQLNELDDAAQAAADADDEGELDRKLDEMWALVRQKARRSRTRTSRCRISSSRRAI